MFALSMFAIGPVQAWTAADWLVAVVIICAAIGITILALRYFEITINPVILKIIGIVVVCVLAVAAIRFVFTL